MRAGSFIVRNIISVAKNHFADQRKEFRIRKDKPILEAFWNWIDQQKPVKGIRLDKEVNYAKIGETAVTIWKTVTAVFLIISPYTQDILI